MPDLMWWSPGAENECQGTCLKNCSCIAYTYDAGIGCIFWTETLVDIQKYDGGAGSDVYIRIPYSELDKKKDHKVVIIASVIASFVASSVCLLLFLWMLKHRRKHVSSSFEEREVVLQSDVNKVSMEEMPLYGFEMLADATNNFSKANKLGMGGFGLVYKGKFGDGKEIVVKSLSEASGQGQKEFMNEVVVISKLQHRNLVRLLGCCVEKGEKMLVYEYLQNGSLDIFLFDKTQLLLDWGKRLRIIEGIGLLYLHRDSRLRIIHRDLKPSNILMDENWIPKISDFGMARIFGGTQDQEKTARVVGTYGYMAPEYAMRGRFSEKSDFFSFGVLMLEIISGKRNTSFNIAELSLGLLGYAWKLWKEDNAGDMIDERIRSSSLEEQAEMVRCIHIGLLCVQESAASRPTISTVLSMLASEIVDLPGPEHPGFNDRVSCSPAGESSSSLTHSANKLTLTTLDGR